jgi:hypothetical protein
MVKKKGGCFAGDYDITLQLQNMSLQDKQKNYFQRMMADRALHHYK